jgi:hypothetical protein
MDFNTFKKRYQEYSNENLIVIITKDKNKYVPNAIKAAIIILSEREVDTNLILEEQKQEELKLQNEMTERRYIENLEPLSQMEYLSSKRLEVEENIESIISVKNSKLTDEELIEELEEITSLVIENNSFGETTEIHSKTNYQHILELLYNKKVTVNSSLNKKITMTNVILYKKITSKFSYNILISIFIFLAGLLATISSGGGMIFYGALITGFVNALINFVRLNRFKKINQLTHSA